MPQSPGRTGPVFVLGVENLTFHLLSLYSKWRTAIALSSQAANQMHDYFLPFENTFSSLPISPGFAAGVAAAGLAEAGAPAAGFAVFPTPGAERCGLASLCPALVAGPAPPTTVALAIFAGWAPSIPFFTRIEILRFEGS